MRKRVHNLWHVPYVIIFMYICFSIGIQTYFHIQINKFINLRRYNKQVQSTQALISDSSHAISSFYNFFSSISALYVGSRDVAVHWLLESIIQYKLLQPNSYLITVKPVVIEGRNVSNEFEGFKPHNQWL